MEDAIFIENAEDFVIERQTHNKNARFSFVCQECKGIVTYSFSKIKVFPYKCESCRKKKKFSDVPIELTQDSDIIKLKEQYKQTQPVAFLCPDCNTRHVKPLRLIESFPVYCKQCQTKRTNIQKYGTDSAIKNSEVSSKRIRTTIERYGGVGFASGKITEKAVQTMKEKFGVNNAMKSIELCNKALDTKSEKYGDDYVKNLLKDSAQNLYGVDNFMQVKEIAEKSYHTKKEKYGDGFLRDNLVKSAQNKYGVDNFMKVDEIKNKSVSTQKEKYGDTYIQDRVKKYLLDNYGVDNAMYVPELKEKVFDTKIKKYGCVQNFPNVIASHNKFLSGRLSETESLNLEWLDSDQFRGKYDGAPIYYTFKCNKCGNVFKDDFHSGMPVCRKCNPSNTGTSHQEQELMDYVKSIYTGEIRLHDRQVLNGKELDIYLPEINVAIEYNGTYWHGYRKDTKLSLSEFKRNVEYKRLKCSELGIRLINIDEMDYVENPSVFHRFIKDVICPRTRIYARNCEIVSLTTQEARKFCEEYHVNGYRAGNQKIGLKYNGELIVVAVFGKHKKYENECIRLCYKTSYNVIGGWAKIVKHFGKPFLHYVNLKYFTGTNETGCGYRFYFKGRKMSRQQLQKKNLRKYIPDMDDSLSDFTNCLKAGGIAIFDCGNDIRFYNQKES